MRLPFRTQAAAFGCAVFFLVGCTKSKEEHQKGALPQPRPSSEKQEPKRLYVPQVQQNVVVDLSGNSHQAENVTFGPSAGAAVTEPTALGACGSDMVLVGSSFCIDRFEFSLVDRTTGRELSPHYPPDKSRVQNLFERWTRKAPRSGRALGRDMPVPVPPLFMVNDEFAPRARSVGGKIPAGYMSRGLAAAACKNAGKRLCLRQEWVRACRGERNTNFPYGDTYQHGTCNVHRNHHPARLLHGDPSRNHLDPRLLLTEDEQGPLLKRTGQTTECASRWGNDAIYDMVGNLDEWIEEPEGSFLGGFFSRATREGCGASIDSHSPGYLDYSLGGRCCADPKD